MSPFAGYCIIKSYYTKTPRVGLEPTTTRLTAECSTIELWRNILFQKLPEPAARKLLLSSSSECQPTSILQTPFLLTGAFRNLRSCLRQSSRLLLPLSFPLASALSVISGISVLEKRRFLQHNGIRRRPTLPGRFQPSTISVWRLNFCVRYGNRWIPPAIVTGNRMHFSNRLLSCSRPFAVCFRIPLRAS